MKNIIYIALTAILLNACTPEESQLLGLEITTTAATNISDSFATTGGNITNDGGSAITARGVCWSTSANPTLSGSYTVTGTGSGSFSTPLSSLIPNTTYYVRAYATNADGTTYGNEISFTTTICPATMTDIDGNVYNVVQIGTQCWMQENLKTTRYKDGVSIPTGLNDAQWGATTSGAYAIYNNNPANETLYGKLYNFYAVNTGKLAPSGWHVPSDAEFVTLITFLGGNAVAGGAMKSLSSAWLAPNTGATNSSGFTANPGGLRSFGGTFQVMNYMAVFWTTSSYPSTGDKTSYGAQHNSTATGPVPVKLREGLSVRCIKN